MTRGVLTVSQLTDVIKEVLETAIPVVWVRGEVSDLSRPQSGHIYFTLKDRNAQIRAVIWRSGASRLKFEVVDGMEIECCGVLDVYAPRGLYQLNVQSAEPVGEGAKQLALKKLHAKLSAEGLFSPSRKRPLPRFPSRIAIITSLTGAAIRDFLEVLRRRWHGINVVIIPSRVQGEGASAEIVERIKLAGRISTRPEVLVLARGGGSVEDLWNFNDERVVRAIAQCPIPVVSAIGHEIDVTLADLVADVRALTPTEAAERVVPSRDDVLGNLKSLQSRLDNSLRNQALQMRGKLDALAQRRVLRRPFELVHDRIRQVDEHAGRMERSMRNTIQQKRELLAGMSGRLQALNPLQVLERGYSLTEDERGVLVLDASQLEVGRQIVTRLAKGRVLSSVDQVRDD